MSLAQALCEATRRQTRRVVAGEVEHDALRALSERIEEHAPSLSQADGEALAAAWSELVRAVASQRDEVRAKLGSVAGKNRGIRGFGRTIRNPATRKGQRVNRDV